MLHIEIFPAEKSCEQGCSICPLARKEKSISATRIDTQVQDTFSVIESVMHEKSQPYSINFTTSLNLFPKVKHPELITKMRLETNKEIGLNGNAQSFSDGFQMLVKNLGINLEIAAFSVVPASPVLSEADAVVISRLIGEIKQWHFTAPNKHIEVTVRTNLIPEPAFQEVLPNLFPADKIYLKQAVKEHAVLSSWKRRPKLIRYINSTAYFNQYEGAVASHGSIIASNRVIGHKPVADNEEMRLEQARWSYPRDKSLLSIVLAPRGVMLMHSSLIINNPIFWLTHSDFRKSLLKAAIRPGFSVLGFLQKMIQQNFSIYSALSSRQKEDGPIANENWRYEFEKWRPFTK